MGSRVYPNDKRPDSPAVLPSSSLAGVYRPSNIRNELGGKVLRQKRVSFSRNVQLAVESESESDSQSLLEAGAWGSRFRFPEVPTARRLRHKCERLVSPAGGLLRNYRSRLVGRLGYFLDSRNVTPQDDPIGSNGRYDKVLILEQAPETPIDKPAPSSSCCACGGCARSGHSRSHSHAPLRYNNCRQSQQLPVGCKEKHFCRKKSCSTRHRCQLLLDAIVHPRKGLNKTTLLLSLLRAPIVLAALFSFLLFLSMMTLYTLTFTHYHYHLQQDHARRLFQQENKFPNKSANEVSPLGSNHNSDIGGLHLITSRHLLRTSSAPTYSGKAADDEVEVSSRSAFDRALTVQTECGAFVGSPEHSSIVFKGIPYASPPVGFRRWTRPRPVWLDSELCRPRRVSEMREFQPHCAQVSPMTHRFTGQEDCLYLDIYVPRLAPQIGATGAGEKKLPVMVYIHGGFLSFGSSGSARADQTDQVNWMRAGPSGRLASELGIVLVSFNYRLQALGFMTLQELAQNNGPFGSEGNYGLWDQLAALNWIKRNIESFGGDPNNIVLFGPDSASALPLATLSQANFGRQSGNEPPDSYDEQEEGEVEFGRNWNTGPAMMSSPGGPAENLTTSHAAEAPAPPAALDANQIDSVAATTPPEVSPAAREAGKLDTHDLFRAAWLANPTVYYDLPYELANQHYQRLFLNQSPCRDRSQKVSPAAHYAGEQQTLAQTKLEPHFQEHEGPAKNNESLLGMIRAKQQQRAAIKGPSSNQQHENQMLDCLMSLSDEEVVRYYLGKDNPSYRLDDQNSLPIHGIFADQFVTLDRELVRHSYPFGVGGAGNFRPFGQKQTEQRARKQPGKLNENNSLPKVKVDPIKSPCSPATPISNNNNNDNNAAAAKGHYKSLGELNDSGSNYRTGDASGANGRAEPLPRSLSPALPANSALPGPSLLLGSTAQAVEYWPCPTNLNQWNWDDFKRYTATSLNSFASNTYAQAASLYQVPQDASKNLTQAKSPKETYLSMTSDIRQLCPVNELAQSLSSGSKQQAAQVFRYVVEHRPSSPFPVSGAPSSGEKSNENNNIKPEFAFHNWDLIAFFGFEFEPEFEPTESDRRFQTQIRKMVRDFVFDKLNLENTANKPANASGSAARRVGSPTLVLGADGNRKLVAGYKRDQCAMWRRHLGRSYAWVS